MRHFTTLVLFMMLLLTTSALSQTNSSGEGLVLLCTTRQPAEQMATVAQVFGFKAASVLVGQFTTPQAPSATQACFFQKVDIGILNTASLVTVYPARNPDNQTRFGVVQVKLSGTTYWGVAMYPNPDKPMGSLPETTTLILADLGALLPASRTIQSLACLRREDIEFVIMTRQVSGSKDAERAVRDLMKPVGPNQSSQCWFWSLDLEKTAPIYVVTVYPPLGSANVTYGIVEVPVRGFPRMWAVIQFNPAPPIARVPASADKDR